MLVSRLVPLLALGAVAVHSGPAIKERLVAATGIGDKVVTKQRETAIIEAATLAATAAEDFNFESLGGFHAWVKRSVRIKNGTDPSVDSWGTPFKGELRGAVLTVTSAGPDKAFGTKDDIKQSGNIFDF